MCVYVCVWCVREQTSSINECMCTCVWCVYGVMRLVYVCERERERVLTPIHMIYVCMYVCVCSVCVICVYVCV